MAVYSHFNLNSDYTAIKEVQNFTITANVPKRSIAAYTTNKYYVDIEVPQGAFMENITLYWSYSGDTVPCSQLIINENYNYGQMATYIYLYRKDATHYRLEHYVVNTDENAHNAGGYTITAKAHLFVVSE